MDKPTSQNNEAVRILLVRRNELEKTISLALKELENATRREQIAVRDYDAVIAALQAIGADPNEEYCDD